MFYKGRGNLLATNLSSIRQLRLLLDFRVHLRHVRLVRVRLLAVRVGQGLCKQNQGWITAHQGNPPVPLKSDKCPTAHIHTHTQWRKYTTSCFSRREGWSCINTVTSPIHQAVVLLLWHRARQMYKSADAAQQKPSQDKAISRAGSWGRLLRRSIREIKRKGS